MITERDVEKLKSVFATKEDVEKLHTVFATKQELQDFRLETKQEFKSVRLEIADLREEFAEFGKKSDRMLVMMDGIAKVIHEMRMEYAGLVFNLNRHDRWIHQLADTTETKLATE